MVHGPPGSGLFLVRDAYFPGDQEPAARRSRIDLVAREETRMFSEQLLKIELRREGGLRHLREFPSGTEQEDSSAHQFRFQLSLLDHGWHRLG